MLACDFIFCNTKQQFIYVNFNIIIRWIKIPITDFTLKIEFTIIYNFILFVPQISILDVRETCSQVYMQPATIQDSNKIICIKKLEKKLTGIIGNLLMFSVS